MIAIPCALFAIVIALSASETSRLSSADRELLRQKLDEFDQLPKEEQDRIQKLHAALQAESEDAKRYQNLMGEYKQWLDTLTPLERQKILAAENPKERIRIVRELLDTQTKTLAKDLEPLEQDRRGSGSRRRSPFFTKPPEDLLAVSRTLLPKLTDIEKKKYDSLSMRSRFPLLVVLAAKYEVGGSGMIKDAQPFIFDSIYQIVDDPINRFGAKSYAELDPQHRKQFIQDVTNILVLPDIDRRIRFTFLEQQPKEVKLAVDEIARRNPIGSQLLVNILYYKQNPEMAPQPLRQSLRVFSTQQAIEQLAKPPSPPPTHDRPHAPGTRPDRSRRFDPPAAPGPRPREFKRENR